MFTLLWASGNNEGWDRFSNKEDLETRIRSLIREGCSSEDMMVFGPDVDYIVPDEDGTVN